jgi:hypothetical protein
MPTVGRGKKKKTFPYSPAGRKAAKTYAKRMGTKAASKKKY